MRQRPSLVVQGTQSKAAQKPTPDVTVVPGFNAIAGQHHVELRVLMSTNLEGVLSAAAIEQSVSAQLRQAGLTVTKWTSSQSTRPALQLEVF